MDWVLAGYLLKPGPKPTQLAAGNLTAPGIGSYDAIRVYLWLGMADRDTPGLKPLLGTMYGMTAYMEKHVTPPEIVDSTGNVIEPERSSRVFGRADTISDGCRHEEGGRSPERSPCRHARHS